MFTFTPLLGAQSSSPASQSLLEFDGGIKVLVDVGWDESFDSSALHELEKHVSTLSIVLITHPTIEHIGAYAHCCKHIPGFSRVPVYATTPVVNLGKTLVTDLYGGSALAASLVPKDATSSPLSIAPGGTPNLLLQPPTADEIASYFSLIHPLKYSQPHQPIPSPFSPSLSGLTITAYSSGHTLGGTIWHIQFGLESVVYASDWNLARENFFPGAAWLSSGDGGEILEALHRPTALVCSSRGVELADSLARKDRDARIISLIRETVAQGGKVLVPTDSSARVLELAFILDQTWKDNIDGPHKDMYKRTRVYMASKSSSATVRYVQGMLEWVDDVVIRNAELAMNRGDTNPLDWKFVKQIEKKSQVERALARQRPCVMLASDASLEWGFSRQVLESLAADPKNLVILTEKATWLDQAKPDVGRQLWQFYQSQQGNESAQSGAKVVNADGFALDIREANTEPLDANENALYQQYLARQRQMQNAFQGDSAMNETTTTEVGDDQASESSESSDEDDDAEHQGRALNLSAQLTQNKRKIGLTDAELGVNVLLRGKTVHDFDVRNKRGREKMFPFVAHSNRNDEFGDLIKPEDYLRAEERDEIDGVDIRAPGEDADKGRAEMGQKRKWGDMSSPTSPGQKGKKDSRAPNKKVRAEPKALPRRTEPDDIDAIIARATGENIAAAPEANGEKQMEDEESSETEESDYEPEDAEEEGPKKVVFSHHTLALNLRIAYVDFSGLYRLNDLQGLIGRINPRKLIVTAGDENEVQLVAETCRAAENGTAVGEVFTPKTLETVDASVDTNAWTLKLSRQLLKRLQWSDLGEHHPSIASVYGVLGVELVDEKAAEEESSKKKLKLIKAEHEEQSKGQTLEGTTMPVLDLLNTRSTIQHQRTAQPVHVGDLRLAEIRKAVQELGHTAEFRGGGILLVDGTVIVRKSQTTGGIDVEAGSAGLHMPGWRTTRKRHGRLEADTEGSFYAVRRAIYDKLAVVAGA